MKIQIPISLEVDLTPLSKLSTDQIVTQIAQDLLTMSRAAKGATRISTNYTFCEEAERGLDINLLINTALGRETQ